MKQVEISEARKPWDTETNALIRAHGRYCKRYGIHPDKARVIKARHSDRRWRWILQIP